MVFGVVVNGGLAAPNSPKLISPAKDSLNVIQLPNHLEMEW